MLSHHDAGQLGALRPLLPPGLELDLYEGRAYVGLTPFTMTGVRPAWLPPIPFVSRFHETNVRTYVHAGGRDPGVWFFSLDASGALAVLGARALLGLPYCYAQIDMTVETGRPRRPPPSSITGCGGAGPAPRRPPVRSAIRPGAR